MMMNTCNGQKAAERQRVGEHSSGMPMVRPATQANRFYTGNARRGGEQLPGAAC